MAVYPEWAQWMAGFRFREDKALSASGASFTVYSLLVFLVLSYAEVNTFVEIILLNKRQLT